MKQISENEIEVDSVKLSFDYSIKEILEYKNIFIVLIRENKEIPNNIIAYDYKGKEVWKINDIVKAKILRGYYNMEKVSENTIRVYYELGVIFDIDLDKGEIINETFMR